MNELEGAIYDLVYDTCGARFDELNRPEVESQTGLEERLRKLVNDEAWQVYLKIDESHGRILSNQLSFAVTAIPAIRRELRAALEA